MNKELSAEDVENWLWVLVGLQGQKNSSKEEKWRGEAGE